MKCLWCQKKEYRRFFKPGDPIHRLERFGLQVTGAAEWEVWVAECCGHVQFVRPDMKQ